MAVTGGVLESKNVRDLAEEREPSPYWVNDDDQVRDWVNAHSLSDVGKLSSANKIKAIETLMGGYISDDVAAIAQICSSVTDKTEADAIRAKVELMPMTSFSQVNAVRGLSPTCRSRSRGGAASDLVRTVLRAPYSPKCLVLLR